MKKLLWIILVTVFALVVLYGILATVSASVYEKEKEERYNKCEANLKQKETVKDTLSLPRKDNLIYQIQTCQDSGGCFDFCGSACIREDKWLSPLGLIKEHNVLRSCPAVCTFVCNKP